MFTRHRRIEEGVWWIVHGAEDIFRCQRIRTRQQRVKSMSSWQTSKKVQASFRTAESDPLSGAVEAIFRNTEFMPEMCAFNISPPPRSKPSHPVPDVFINKTQSMCGSNGMCLLFYFHFCEAMWRKVEPFGVDWNWFSFKLRHVVVDERGPSRFPPAVLEVLIFHYSRRSLVADRIVTRSDCHEFLLSLPPSAELLWFTTLAHREWAGGWRQARSH